MYQLNIEKMELNVLGTPLTSCCRNPMTGYFRDGFCRTLAEDTGTHTVCAVVTETFLMFSASQGNDLMTPIPHWGFPGLKQGDRWCLCVSRWLASEKAGKAPGIVLEATHQKTLQYAPLKLLQRYGVTR